MTLYKRVVVQCDPVLHCAQDKYNPGTLKEKERKNKLTKDQKNTSDRE